MGGISIESKLHTPFQQSMLFQHRPQHAMLFVMIDPELHGTHDRPFCGSFGFPG